MPPRRPTLPRPASAPPQPVPVPPDPDSPSGRYFLAGVDGKRRLQLPPFGDTDTMRDASKGAASGIIAMTNRRVEDILSALRMGAYRNTAAAIVGISERTFIRWMQGTHPRMLAFQELVREAEALHELNSVRMVTSSDEPGVHLSWLARRYKGKYALPNPKIAINVNTDDAPTPPIDYSRFSRAELTQLRALALKMQPDTPEAVVIEVDGETIQEQA